MRIDRSSRAYEGTPPGVGAPERSGAFGRTTAHRVGARAAEPKETSVVGGFACWPRGDGACERERRSRSTRRIGGARKPSSHFTPGSNSPRSSAGGRRPGGRIDRLADDRGLNAIEGFVAELPRRRLECGVLPCVDEHDEAPKPFLRRGHPTPSSPPAPKGSKRDGRPTSGANGVVVVTADDSTGYGLRCGAPSGPRLATATAKPRDGISTPTGLRGPTLPSANFVGRPVPMCGAKRGPR